MAATPERWEISSIVSDLMALGQAKRPRFLVVAGASGTGKSSVVLARVIPRLRAAGPLRHAYLRPGTDPLKELEAVVTPSPALPLLLIIDQFEGIFTHVPDPAVRSAFARRLWQLTGDPASGISVIVTLRVDFLGRCGEIVLDDAGQRLESVAYDEAHRVFIERLGPTVLRAAVGMCGSVTAAALSPDGALVATGCEGPSEHTAVVWNAETAEPLATLVGHSQWVQAVAFSADGARVATASLDGTATVWVARTGRALFTVKHQDKVLSALFSRDGTLLVTASVDGTARVWNAGTGALLTSLVGHERDVNSAAFSPDGTSVVTASDDATARLWDVRSGKLLRLLEGHEGPLIRAAFSADGASVITVGDDRAAVIWNVGLETPSPSEIATLLRCRVPLRFEGETLVPTVPSTKGCAPAGR